MQEDCRVTIYLLLRPFISNIIANIAIIMSPLLYIVVVHVGGLWWGECWTVV